MRRIVAGAFVCLDGIMQAPGGPEEDPTGGFEHGGWTVPYWDEPMGQFMDECFSQPFDLLLGRRTCEICAAYWPLGSSVLLQTLLAHDLIDEFRPLTFPLVLGRGNRLFGRGTKAGALELAESRVSTTGVTMSVHARADAVTTGSFGLPQASDAELARREQMKRDA